MEWTSPAADVGEVVFYVAGNAANGDGTNSGDRIYSMRARLPSQTGCVTTGKPTITQVIHGASYQPNTIAFDGMFAIKGSGFGPAGLKREADRLDFRDKKYPTEVACLEVGVDGEKVPIAYVSENQINAQAPAHWIDARVKVELTLNPGMVNQQKAEIDGVQMTKAAQAFFTFANGSAIGQHLDFKLMADPSVNAQGTPAQPGEEIVLYGTGFGITDPVYQAGETPSTAVHLRDKVSVTIGAITVSSDDVSYVGLTSTARCRQMLLMETW